MARIESMIDIPASEIAPNIVVTVRIVGMHWFRLRLKIARALIRLSGLVAGYRVEFFESQVQRGQ